MDDYTIPFYGLKEGVHAYDFEIDNWFFEFFDNPDLPGGKLRVLLSLARKPSFLELEFSFKGHLRLICDRCLDEYDHLVDFEQKMFVRFGDKDEEQSDIVVVIPKEETRLNVAQYIYEFAALSIPVKKVHPDDENGKGTCNQEMIRKLEQHQRDSVEYTDPRWEVLKNLKNTK